MYVCVIFNHMTYVQAFLEADIIQIQSGDST